MEFVILIRRTLDWGNITSFPKQGCWDANRWDVFCKTVEKWNKKLNINYFAYRAKLKEIALKSWESTKIPIVTQASLQNDKNLIILPTDDDDWYHPNIKFYLEKLFQDKTLPVVQWRGWVYDNKGKESFNKWTGWNPANACAASNDYAVVHSRFRQYHALYNHSRIPNDKYRKTEEPLSVWLRHPASLLDLQYGKGIKLPLKKSSIPNELGWATEYIKMVRDINLKEKEIKWNL